MRLVYLANVRLPTEKAHGIAIMKACEAFVRAGTELSLVVARRRHTAREDARVYYHIGERFPIRRLPSLDFIGTGFPGAFFVQSLTFYASLIVWALLRPRAGVIYTRDAAACLLSWLGFDVVFECHMVPNRRRLFFTLARRARRIIAVSHTIRAMFLEAGFPEERVVVVPNAVDLEVFDISVSKDQARERLGLPRDAFILGYTGNFTTHGEDKGLLDIFRALHLLDDVLFIAAGGSEVDIERYAAAVQEYGVEEKVRLIGRMPQSALAIYQKAADVLVMPFPDTPYYRSNMSPIKMFEYMAGRRPVIASDLPTIREILDDSTALFVRPDSPEDIAHAARTLRGDLERATQLARAAYERVAHVYDWQVRARRILEILASI